MKPIIEELEKQDSSKVCILRINADRDKEIAAEFEIDAMPVLMLYKGGCRDWFNGQAGTALYA